MPRVREGRFEKSHLNTHIKAVHGGCRPHQSERAVAAATLRTNSSCSTIHPTRRGRTNRARGHRTAPRSSSSTDSCTAFAAPMRVRATVGAVGRSAGRQDRASSPIVGNAEESSDLTGGESGEPSESESNSHSLRRRVERAEKEAALAKEEAALAMASTRSLRRRVERQEREATALREKRAELGKRAQQVRVKRERSKQRHSRGRVKRRKEREAVASELQCPVCMEGFESSGSGACAPVCLSQCCGRSLCRWCPTKHAKTTELRLRSKKVSCPLCLMANVTCFGLSASPCRACRW